MAVGEHNYTVMWIDQPSRSVLTELTGPTGPTGPWIYNDTAYRTLKQAKARAEDDALDRLRKEAADLGLRVVEEDRHGH
jgi:hypothetical protein